MTNYEKDLILAANKAEYELTKNEFDYLVKREKEITEMFSFIGLIRFFIECKDNGFIETIQKLMI